MNGHATTERVHFRFITPHILVRWIVENKGTAVINLDLATGNFVASAQSWDGIHRLITLHTLAQEERALWLAELSRQNPPTIPAPGNR